MRSRHLAVIVALLFPLVASPAGAVTNGRDKSEADMVAHYGKGQFGTVRIDINNGERSCTGTHIRGDLLFTLPDPDDGWVLTAASCFADDPARDYHVQAGPPKKPAKIIFDRNDGPVEGWEFPIVNLVPRPDRDLVLAEVKGTNTGTSAHIATSPPQPGEILGSLGYGRTATDWAPLSAQIGQVKVNSVTATAVNLGGDASVCKGDAGGPVYREVGGKIEIVGVHGVSWQHGCFGTNESRIGSTDARVDDIYTWIRQQISNFNFDCNLSAYSSDTTFYSTKAGGLRSVNEGWNNVREPVKSLPPTYGRLWYGPSAPISASGWTGEIRVGPAETRTTYPADWNHPIWEVHRKTGTQDPFNDGDLRLWTDPHRTALNDPPTPLRGGDRVATGWQRYLDPAYRNQFTVDSQGRVYTIDAAGALRAYNWQPATKTWRNPAGDVIDTGWGRFDSVTASGDGILYARTPDGNLFRFQYDHSANTWTQRDKAAGGGWNAYTSITSPGGDILLGSGTKKDGKPVLRWHRYLTEFDAWAPRDPDGLGPVILDDVTWGSDSRLQATPNMCALRP
jgi:hypothetical protein